MQSAPVVSSPTPKTTVSATPPLLAKSPGVVAPARYNPPGIASRAPVQQAVPFPVPAELDAIFGVPPVLKGAIVEKFLEPRAVRLRTADGAVFLAHSRAFCESHQLDWAAVPHGADALFIPDPPVPGATSGCREVFAACMLQAAPGIDQFRGPFMSPAMAENALRDQWRGQIRVTGVFLRSATDHLMLPLFFLPRGAAMRDLRTRIAAATHILAENQVIATEACILPDEDDFALHQVAAPAAPGQPPIVKFTVANESRLMRWARFDSGYGDYATLAATAAFENWGDTLEVLRFYIKRTFSAALEVRLPRSFFQPSHRLTTTKTTIEAKPRRHGGHRNGRPTNRLFQHWPLHPALRTNIRLLPLTAGPSRPPKVALPRMDEGFRGFKILPVSPDTAGVSQSEHARPHSIPFLIVTSARSRPWRTLSINQG